jgi:hypothetical protein
MVHCGKADQARTARDCLVRGLFKCVQPLTQFQPDVFVEQPIPHATHDLFPRILRDRHGCILAKMCHISYHAIGEREAHMRHVFYQRLRDDTRLGFKKPLNDAGLCIEEGYHPFVLFSQVGGGGQCFGRHNQSFKKSA